MESPTNKPSQLKGKILLADPSLQDPLFKKSVVLLSEYQSDEGFRGFILNHPTAQTVGDLLTSDECSPLSNLQVYIGGPVNQQNLTFSTFWAHDHSTLRYATRISAQKAIDSVHKPGTVVRAFAGCSEWTKGQLEEEIEDNSWITTHADPDLLGQSHERSLWADILRSMSPYHKILAETPDDIFTN